MEKWNIDSAKINAFVAALPPANKQNVLTQICFIIHATFLEAWAEYRRTRLSKYTSSSLVSQLL